MRIYVLALAGRSAPQTLDYLADDLGRKAGNTFIVGRAIAEYVDGVRQKVVGQGACANAAAMNPDDGWEIIL